MDSVTTSAECLKKRDPSYFISDCPRASERFQVKFLPPDRIKNILIGQTNAKFVDITIISTVRLANSMNITIPTKRLQSEQTFIDIDSEEKIQSIELEFTINPIENLTLQYVLFRKPFQRGFGFDGQQFNRVGGIPSPQYQNIRSSPPLRDEMFQSRKNELYKKEEFVLRDAPPSDRMGGQARRVVQEGFNQRERDPSPNQITGYFKLNNNKKQGLTERSFREFGLNGSSKGDSQLTKAIENSLRTEETEKKIRLLQSEAVEKIKIPNSKKEDSNDFDADLLKVLEQSKREEELKQEQLKREAEEVLRQAKKYNSDKKQKLDELDDDIVEISFDDGTDKQQEEKKEISKRPIDNQKQQQQLQQQKLNSLKELQIPQREYLPKSPEMSANKNTNSNNINKTPRSPQPKPSQQQQQQPNRSANSNNNIKQQDATIRKNSYENQMEIENQELPDIEFIPSPMKSRQTMVSTEQNNPKQQRNQFPITTGMLSNKLLEWQRKEEIKRNIKPEMFLYKPPGISSLLKGLNICISGAEGEEHASIKSLILSLGGKYQKDLSEICDYMIASSTKTNKYNQYQAQKDNLPKLKIVTKQFLFFCKNNKQLPPNWQTFKLTLG